MFNFTKRARVFSLRVTVDLLFSFLLLKTFTSVFLQRFESLKLKHDTYYLMTSKDTVEDPLMSVKFYIKSKVFSFRVTVHLLFLLLLQKSLKSVFQPRYESLKLNHDTNCLMTSEETVEDPLMSVQFYKKSKSFFVTSYSQSTVFFLLLKTFTSVFLQRFECLKLKHDTNYLMKSKDTVEDPLMSVQFYKKSKVFSFRVTDHLLFSFLLQKSLKSVFLPRYESLKLNHNTNCLMTSEDTFEDPLMSVQFYKKSKSFFVTCYSRSTVFFLLLKALTSVFLQHFESLKLNHDTNYLMTSEDTLDECSILYKEQEFFHFVLKSI